VKDFCLPISQFAAALLLPLNFKQLQVWSKPHSVPSEAGPHFDNFAAARYSYSYLSREATNEFSLTCSFIVAPFLVLTTVFVASWSSGKYLGSAKHSLRCHQCDIGLITVLKDSKSSLSPLTQVPFRIPSH
jgi:hypothetical protein